MRQRASPPCHPVREGENRKSLVLSHDDLSGRRRACPAGAVVRAPPTLVPTVSRLVEVDRVLVDHADAAGRDTRADRPGLDRAVDAVERVLVALHRYIARAPSGLPGPPGMPRPLCKFRHIRLELGLALDHLLRRIPVRPFLLVRDSGHARPAEALAADADAVADGAAAVLHEVEEMACGIDDDRARRLLGAVAHHLAQEGGIDLLVMDRRDGNFSPVTGP